MGLIDEIRAALGRAAVDVGSGLVWQDDALALLARLPDESVDLVVTSPPYNIGKEYESPLLVSEYVEWCSNWLAELRLVRGALVRRAAEDRACSADRL